MAPPPDAPPTSREAPTRPLPITGHEPAPAAVPTPEPTAEAADERREERARRLVARSRVLPRPPDAGEPTEPAARGARPPARTSAPASAPATPAARAAPGSLASVIKIAERAGRTDLSSRLEATRNDLRRTGVTVAIVGEFKKGKSNLLNALVNAEVCPSDPVSATVAPIYVRHGEELGVELVFADGRHETTDAGLDRLAEVASEVGNEGNRMGLTRAEITIPRRLLAAGMGIVDTPGVGGLDSAMGSLTLASLESCDGVLFVTDCSQELTAPELAYLHAARARCAAVICVMTKRDLHHHAPVLIQRNRAHLDRAGLGDVQVLAVSSVLHLLALAQTDQELELESGFEALFDALHRTIWEPARRQGLADTGEQLAHLADHLALPLEAERRALSSPDAAERTIGQLAEVQDRVRQFRSAAARWQQRLAEGMQDATGDLDHDLRTRLRVVNRTAEGRIDSEGSVDDLVFEAWLHKAAIEAVIAHYDGLVDRTSALADEVAEHFVAFDRNAAFRVEGAPPDEMLAAVHIAREQKVAKDGVVRRIVTTGQGYSSGMVLASSVVAFVIPVSNLIPLVILPVAGFMARRAFSDDRDRRRAARRQELKRLAARYLDEIGFVVHKHSRDTLRRIHREVRDHYLARAEQLEVTLQQATAAAARARDQAGEPSDAAHAALDHSATAVRQIRAAASQLVAAAPRAS